MSDLLAQTRDICKLLEIKPARSKGQNFLINEKIYDEIVKAADIRPEDTVLEIGPGLGFLTVRLAHVAKRVIAVELDDKLANYLQMGVDSWGINNVEVVNQDILKFDPGTYLPAIGPYKIVANLPYNITSIFLRRFLGAAARPSSLVLMLQQEVAERIVAVPPDMSILAVSVQYYAEPRIIRTVKAGNFWPEPEIDSAIIQLDLKPQKLTPAEDKKFFQMVRIGFSAKRKMLKNNLAAGLRITPKVMENLLVEQDFDPKVRAEDLTLPDWYKLFAALTPFVV
jgi:16S rRNA (adenine1518-N6/adenine1519-N6)-dimethyltransferase